MTDDINTTDVMALSYEQLEELHRAAYVKRYPGLKRNTAGELYQPTGSSPHQWGLVQDDTRGRRELYIHGYKPKDARRVLEQEGA